MDEKNRNIFDTFGNYNNSAGEVKNVSSSDWTPISAGKDYHKNRNTGSAQNRGGTARKNTQPNKKSNSRSLKSSDKKSKDNDRLISQGKPVSEKKKSQSKSRGAQKSTAAKKETKNTRTQTPLKKSQAQTTPASRTPSGKDLRDDARKNQKHREELLKSRENYRKSSHEGKNHDEICKQSSQTKRKKMAIKNAVPIVVVFVLALFVMLFFFYSNGALIENIIIEGTDVYTAEQIYQAAGISKGKNMYSFRETKIKRELTKNLPYIKDVKYERQLPDTVILTVKTTTDKYVISNGTGSFTLDTDGKVVSETKQTLEKGMYRVEGFESQKVTEGFTFKPSEANAEKYALMKEIATLFDKSGVIDFAVIYLNNTDDVKVVYKERIAVYLGDCKNLEKKIPHASGIIAQVAPRGLGGYIDMRYDELGFFKPGSMDK